MKIVCLQGSPRKESNSSAIAERLMRTAGALGAETASYRLNSLAYSGCQGCYACKKGLEGCVIKDDLSPVLEAVRGADVLVMSSPVYYGDVTGQLKCFIDRSYSFLKPDYATNPQPSRLSPKKLVMVLTQGHPDEHLFGDVFPRYNSFFAWMGFHDGKLLRACGVGPATTDAPPEELLREAEEAARQLVR